MKTYGLIVADNGSDLYVQGTYDRRWDNDLLNPAFASLTAGDFEVIQLGWRPSSPPTGKPSAPGDLVATASARRRVELTWRDRSTNETSFEVELRLGDRPSDPFRKVATVSADTHARHDRRAPTGESLRVQGPRPQRRGRLGVLQPRDRDHPPVSESWAARPERGAGVERGRRPPGFW